MNSGDIAIRFNSVSFSYPNVHVLDDASFHIHCGEFIAMVGPNGSGKTTILKLLFGMEFPIKGSIEIFCGDDHSAGNKSRMNYSQKSKMAYVPQHIPSDQSFPISVRDIVRMGLLLPSKRYSHDKSAVDEAMVIAGIADISSRAYNSLSGGQKRRVLAARALAAKPEILVLDEPTANMDSESEKRFYESLALLKGKTTILIVTHDSEFVSKLTDRVLCLGDGSRKVVEHRIDTSTLADNEYAGHGVIAHEARVLHGENISIDKFCRSD